MKTIGERLKEVRKELGMSQEDLARALNISSQETISRWERGRNYPSADTLQILHEKYGISADWLITGQGDMKRGQAKTPPPGAFDRDLMMEVIWELERGLSKRSLTLAPKKKSQLIVLLYERFLESGASIDEEVVQEYLKLVS